MLMSWIFTIMVTISLVSALICGKGSQLAGGIIQGAQGGITLAISMAGGLCLWSGVGKLMEKCGITELISKLLRPLLIRIVPETKTDRKLSGVLSANICANFLGLGNAATPMGLQAARLLAKDDRASDSFCRLVILNTASIQLIPVTVAAIRAGLGCRTPFDILPQVWLTSLAAAFVGLGSAWLLGKVWKK